MSQVQKKSPIIEYSQDEDFFNDELLDATPFQATYQSESVAPPLEENEVEIEISEEKGRNFRVQKIPEGEELEDMPCANNCKKSATYFIRCRFHDEDPWERSQHLYCSKCMLDMMSDDGMLCGDCEEGIEYYAETFEASTGKRMYCPKCKTNRTWNRGFKKHRLESGENPYDFVFYVCKNCDYAIDGQTKEEIKDWRVKYGYSAEEWEDTDWENHTPTIDPSPFEEIEWKQLPPPPANISHLMRAFIQEGYSCLVVGGAIRDLLLGLEPKDYDLATDATPDEVEEVVNKLEGYRYVLGPQAEKSRLNLTSLVNVPNEKEAVEITTFREELGYEGDRTKGQFIPAKTFTEDSSRRDLTINAMGMTVDGVVIDPQGGLEDLQNGVIRAVGDPTQRFVEDPLRMIRAIRFSVRFGLPIETETYDSIVDNADLVKELSSRRLRDEIGKVIVEPNGYQMLMETGILPVLVPEFRNMTDYHHKLDYHPEGSLYNHYIEAFKKYTTIPNRSELGAWALLFHDIAKPQTADWNEEGGYHTFYGHDKQGAQLVLDNYNNTKGPFEFSKKELQAIAWTTDNHLGKFWESKKPMKVSTMRNNENFPLLVEVVTGDTMGIRRGGDEELERRLKEINEITNKVNEQKAKTGNRPKDFARKVIQQLNVQGKEISIALGEIEEMVSTGQVASYDEALEVLKTKRNA